MEKKDFEKALGKFISTLKDLEDSLDAKEKKALKILRNNASSTLAGFDDETTKTLAYGILLGEDISWKHETFLYPVEFEAVWAVYNFSK